MPRKQSQRLLFCAFVVAALCIIGRNLYKRHLNALLFSAIDSADVQAVHSLLSRGADVNATRQATPALLYAIRHRVLPRNDLEVNMPDKSPSPPASPEVSRDTEAIACLLIDHHADLRFPRIVVGHDEQETVSSYDNAGYIEEACRQGSVPTLRCLLDKGVMPTPQCLTLALQYAALSPDPPVTVSRSPSLQQVHAGATATDESPGEQQNISRQMAQLLREHGLRPTLAQWVELNDIAALKAELEAGISPNPQHSNEQAPLELAILAGNLEMVKLLLAHGANVNDSRNRIPLEAAVAGRHLAIARLLLASGAAPDVTSGSRVYSSLPGAITLLPELVPELLRRGANVNVGGGSILQAALHSRNIALVQELLRRGVNVNPTLPPQPSTDGTGGTSDSAYKIVDVPDLAHPGRNIPQPFSPLLNAMLFAPEAEAMLLKAGANIGPDKTMILASLAKCGRVDLFARALELGADVNGVDADGETALSRAVTAAPTGVSILLAHGANPNVLTKSQYTPLGMAAGMGNAACARLLLAHGAMVNLRAPRGHTPLYWARKNNSGREVPVMSGIITNKDLKFVTKVVQGRSNTETIGLLERAGAKAE